MLICYLCIFLYMVLSKFSFSDLDTKWNIFHFLFIHFLFSVPELDDDDAFGGEFTYRPSSQFPPVTQITSDKHQTL